MTDIKLDVKVEGTRELRRAADELLRTGNISRKLASEFSGTAASNMRLVKETRRLEAVQRQLDKAVKDRILTQNKATRAYNEEVRKSKEKVLTDSTIIAQQKKAAKAAKELAAENERLVRAYAPAKVAADQFRESVKNIDKALARNLITAEEHTEAMRVLNFEFNQFTKGAATGGNQFAKFNVEAYKSAQTIKRQFNTGMQQAGYQVGDFFVQIQSGQSALVALGQQGSQLAGIFGPGGALVGAFLAIGTAIATVVVQAKKAEEALHSMKIGFQEATRGATEAIKQLRIENFQLTENIENVTEAMLLLAASEQEAAAKANDLRNETSFLGRTGLFEFGGGFTIAGFEIIKTDEEKLELLKEQRRVLLEQLETNKELLRQKEAEVRSINQRFKAEAQLFEMEVSQSAEVLALTAERAERERRAMDERFKGEAEVFNQSVTISKELIKLTEERAKKEERAIDQRFKGEAGVFAQAVTISKELVALTEKIAEAERRSIDERFKGEAQVFSQAVTISKELLKLAEKKAETERRAINERFEGEAAVFALAVTVSNELLRRADELAERQRRAVDERFKGEAAVFSQAVAISSDVQDLIDKRREKEQRALDERFKGEAEVFSQTVEVAEDLLDLIEQKAEDAARIVKAKFEAEDFLFRVRFADETALMQQSLTPAKQKGPETERQKTLKNIQDTIDALKEQTAQETKLLALTGERLKEEEIFYDLLQANKDADIKLSEQKLRAIAKEIAAQKQANEVYEKTIEFVGGIEGAFSDFIAGGLKDFKDFVGSIKDMFIRLLADLVAQAAANRILIPIATGFMGGFGNAAAGATTANLIAGGGMAGSLAAGASSFGAGLQASLGMGGFTSAGVFNVGANAAVATAATGVGASATMATLGAAVPLIAAGVALFSLFGKKKKPDISPENMNKVVQALKMTGQELEGTRKEAGLAAKALGEVAGGFDKLTKKAQAYFENFYTEGERRAIAATEATQALNKTFADLEMAVPKTHAEFRQLVEAQDLMTEEGRETYNTLLDVSGAFVTLNGTMQQVSERAATLRQEELALREARSLSKLEKFIGEDAADATLERLSAVVYSGNVESLVDGVFQEIFEALTPDGTQMRKITPYLEELTGQLEEVVENLSATDDILRKYASGDIIGEIRKFTKQMQREVRYLVDFSGGTPEGIAYGIFSSVRTAAQNITRVAKMMIKDLGIIFTEFAAEFKVENVLDESRKVTDRIDELLSAFTATRDSLLSSYTKAAKAFDKAPSFDRTTEAGQEAFEAMIAAGRALSRARQEIDKLTTTINTLNTSSRAFEQAVADKLVEPIKEALTVYLPTALDDLPQDIKNTMGGLFAGITEGSLEGFQSAYVQLAELFTTNKITVDQFNTSFKIMEDTFRGNISLTDQYTTKQQTVIEKLSRAYDDFTSKLQNLLGVVQGGIDSLLGQATSANVVASRRGSQAYLRTVARTGEFDAGRLERAVGAVSGGDTVGFGSRQDFLRYVADTTNVLNAVKGTLEGQLDTLQMKQVKSILKIEETSTSSAESLQSIQSLLAEFLGVGGRVPAFAAGGYHSGGLRIVGERGPELEATGPSRIIPAGEFAVGGVSALRQEIAEMKDQLYNGLVQVAKYTRKSSETLNKFDYDGLPSDRGY